MASIFGHAAIAIAVGQNFSKHIRTWKFWTLGIFCTILPDVDVLSFQLGIRYEDFFGHRGFSHSLLFAITIAFLFVLLFYKKYLLSSQGFGLFLFFSFCTASHGLLDSMTTGGLGIAFFSPWDDTRYFLPWRPIQVSPIGITNFFGEWGRKVLLSELFWIGIPSLLYIAIAKLFPRVRIK